MVTEPEVVSGGGCPGCGSLDMETSTESDTGILQKCGCCGGLIGDCSEGWFYRNVDRGWADSDVPPERMRYFDLVVDYGDEGRKRVHGWYDPETKRVCQFG